MVMTVEQRHIIERRIENWRKLDATIRERAWYDAVIDLAVNSMAMEAEPVSKTWVQKAKANRA
jgi:hypothetical protein